MRNCSIQLVEIAAEFWERTNVLKCIKALKPAQSFKTELPAMQTYNFTLNTVLKH